MIYSEGVHRLYIDTVFFCNICKHLQILVCMYVSLCVGGNVLEKSGCRHHGITLVNFAFLYFQLFCIFQLVNSWILFRVIVRKWCSIAVSCSLHSFYLIDSLSLFFCFLLFCFFFPFGDRHCYFICYSFGINGILFFFPFCTFL